MKKNGFIRDYPDVRIKDALRISFAIPLYFEPVIIDEGRLKKLIRGIFT